LNDSISIAEHKFFSFYDLSSPTTEIRLIKIVLGNSVKAPSVENYSKRRRDNDIHEDPFPHVKHQKIIQTRYHLVERRDEKKFQVQQKKKHQPTTCAGTFYCRVDFCFVIVISNLLPYGTRL
jgi:predicted ATP-dependent protease